MDPLLRRSSISLCILSGCAADVPFDALDPEAPYDVPTAASPRASITSLHCDGTPLPVCDGPFTGATCDLPCTTGPNDPPTACGLDSYCHSDGSVYSLSTRNALLHPGSPDDSPDTIQSDFEHFIATHATDLSLEAGLSPDDLSSPCSRPTAS